MSEHERIKMIKADIMECFQMHSATAHEAVTASLSIILEVLDENNIPTKDVKDFLQSIIYGYHKMRENRVNLP